MAQVTKPTQHDIDTILVYLMGVWRDLPNAVNEIDNWDLEEQIAYIEEWSPTEGLLERLQEYDRLHLLDTAQSEQLRDLEAVVQEHHPLLVTLRNQ